MRLYHFIRERFGLEAIRDSRLKIARLNDLNDPFEFLGLKMTPDIRPALKSLKNEMADRYGLICMSKTWQHPLLWGHYADSHRGLCLGFDVPDDGTFAVVHYRPDRPTLAEFGRQRVQDIDESDMIKMLYTKFDAWRYEEEFRCFTRLEEKDPVSGYYFADFGDKMMLREVIVGERCNITFDHLQEVLGERHPTALTYRGRAGFMQFQVVQNRSGRVWPQAHPQLIHRSS